VSLHVQDQGCITLELVSFEKPGLIRSELVSFEKPGLIRSELVPLHASGPGSNISIARVI